MKKSEKLIIISTAICLLVVIAFGFSYAYFEIIVPGTTDTFKASCYDVSYSEESSFTINNAYPMSDAEGATQPAYTITVTNNCNRTLQYNVQIEVLSESTTSNSSIRIGKQLADNNSTFGEITVSDLTTFSTGTKLASSNNSYIVYSSESLSAHQYKKYAIRAWLKESVTDDQNTTFKSRVTIQLLNNS